MKNTTFNMPPTPFEAGKNAKELNIDLTREFAMVDGGGFYKAGAKFISHVDDDSPSPFFKDECGKVHLIPWYRLAYYEPTPEVKEEYVPCEGDLLKCTAEIERVDAIGRPYIVIKLVDKTVISFHLQDSKGLELLSRPTPKKSMTLAQIEAALGYAVNLINE